jgi:caffeoyl-CoA O-methyltransferase
LPDVGTDLVFIDAEKQNYQAYYEGSMRILKVGGLILADNALWYGRIFNPKDDNSRAVAEFNELVKTDARAEKLFLTIRDGVYVIRKLAEGG